MDYDSKMAPYAAEKEKQPDYMGDSSSGYTSAAGISPSAGRLPGDPEVGEVHGTNRDFLCEKQASGEAKFKRLGWKRLTIVLIVEAIALGALSLPSAFATLGMVAGVICSIGMGLIAVYTAYVIGQLKLKFPHISDYAEAGRLMFGRVGFEIIGAMLMMMLVLIVSSHVLTGKIMWATITDNGKGTCSIVFGVVSAILLFLLAIPPSFAEVAILGYIDFVSIVLAIGITMIATGVQASQQEGGLAAVNWSAWPKEGVTLQTAFIAITNIAFAYSFAMCQFSFMDEMHTLTDYKKSIVALGGIEIGIYTLTGALIYSFVGVDVESPALLSAGPMISKIAFGVALPVIIISGSINTVVLGKTILGRAFKNSVIRYVNTPKGWMVWLGLNAGITVLAWVIAEAIPIFSNLLAISSSLFISGFSYYLPACMWFLQIKEGSWRDRKNLGHAIANAVIFVIGLTILGVGTYSAVKDMIFQFDNHLVSTPFSCGY
ncbi:transmembrane amino acid transporter protein-domain-containing protein [Echria macrotheca]|uniref:Transmembrane amino acid transporter protein-domain-containing protein n=1 Tax=Echria macrotheca TaxID=438768 RepID=A0AAJ0BC52_9PEZI|nr:transmembrane amino acid transporter protein-domain-containing protein [Echria macrotheca]